MSWSPNSLSSSGNSSVFSVELRASIKVRIHYYEDANVQLNTSTESNNVVVFNPTDPDATGKAIVNAVDQVESDFQAQLEEFYVSMHSKTFKSMRRFYPITRTPMIWNPNSHHLVQEVHKNEPK